MTPTEIKPFYAARNQRAVAPQEPQIAHAAAQREVINQWQRDESGRKAAIVGAASLILVNLPGKR